MSVPDPLVRAYTDRFRLRAAVYLLPRRDGKVLLALRRNTGFGDGLYGVIGGHLDGDEPARIALIREAAEEAGMTIAPDSLVPRLVMHRAPQGAYDEAVDFFFDLTTCPDDPVNTEPHKCAGFLWADPANLPANTVPYVARALTAIMAGETYLEFGWDTV